MQNSRTGHIRGNLPIYLGLLLFFTRVLWPISANESSELEEDLAQIVRPRRQYIETTALGAAYLAGLFSKVIIDTGDIEKHWKYNNKFKPKLTKNNRNRQVKKWHYYIKKLLD